MLWLGLHFAELGLEIFQQAQQHQAPVVLLQDNRVVLCNEQARQAGILPGATLATAHTINTELVHYHHDPVQEQQRLNVLAECLYQLSSHVCLYGANGITLEISRSLKLAGSAERLQQQAAALTTSLGHKVSARIANTPSAAMALACSGQSELNQVPLPAIGLDPATVERLHNMGIYRLEPLLKLPSKELGARFGKTLLTRMRRLLGEQADPQQSITPSPQFDRSLHLLEPIRSKQGLAFPMQRLLTELQHWLVARQLAVQHIAWEFSAYNDDAVVMEVKFARPLRTKQSLLSIIQLKLEQQELPADILDIKLRAVNLLSWQEDAQDLFQQLSKGHTEATRSDLINQLSARLGEEVCSTLTLEDQHHPQWNWRRLPIWKHGEKPARAPINGSVNAPAKAPSAWTFKHNRPIWLLECPQAVTEQELTLLQGPERIRTGWWAKGILRDYYIAQYRNGANCWVFVDNRQQWYLHGYFA